MAASYRANAMASTASATSLACTMPTFSAGDLLLLAFASESLTAAITGGLSAWTLREGPVRSNENESLWVYWDIAAGGDTAPTVTVDTAAIMACNIISIQGTDSTTPIDVSSNIGGVVGTSWAIPSVNTTGTNELLVQIAFQSTSAANSWTGPGTQTERFDVEAVSGVRHENFAMGDEIIATASSTGTRTWTSSATTGSALVMLAVNSPLTIPPTGLSKDWPPASFGPF